MTKPVVVLAGAAGDLGTRIAKALVDRGAEVRALTRLDAAATDRERVSALGANIAMADMRDARSVAAACAGAGCVVSALNGLHDVIVDRQSVLLAGAVQAGVPRFISSDYSADFTKTIPGQNRNFDLRREFMVRADRVPIKVTSILNGAFMDMLGAEMPIIRPGIRRVLYWGRFDQLLDFTTKDDVAAYASAAALDAETPRILRIAGDTVSVRSIAAAMSTVTRRTFHPLRVGGMGSLGMLIRLTRLLVPQPDAAFPPWQGMQYMRDMFSGKGKLTPLDNDRYPDMRWTSVSDHLAQINSP